MRRFLIFTVTTAGLLLLAPAQAWAHEEIDPATVPTGKPLFLTLSGANEKKVDMTKLTLTTPSGLDFGEATKDPAGWTSTKSDKTITWTGGAVKPGRFEQFGFEVESFDQPGSPQFKASLGYADGTSEDAQVALTVTAATESATAKGGGSDSGPATVAIVVALVALVASVIAVALARSGRSRPAAGAATGAAAGGSAAGSQDW